MQTEVFEQIDPRQADDELERSITQLLEPQIRRTMTGDEPFYVQHGPYENETRRPPPAQPPQYDIAFVLSANPRIMWPLEAKVLRTDKTIALYVTDIVDEFLTCRYAPFSSEAAMLGYLFTGNPGHVFTNIAEKLKCTLYDHSSFPKRQHKTSKHMRTVPADKAYPQEFRCHHLIMMITHDLSRSVYQTRTSARNPDKE